MNNKEIFCTILETYRDRVFSNYFSRYGDEERTYYLTKKLIDLYKMAQKRERLEYRLAVHEIFGTPTEDQRLGAWLQQLTYDLSASLKQTEK